VEKVEGFFVREILNRKLEAERQLEKGILVTLREVLVARRKIEEKIDR
jgi:hypothetical protein